jgi:nitrogenase molybdenum-cofactor synthesis protein NifE
MFKEYRTTSDKSLPEVLAARNGQVQIVTAQATSLVCEKPSLAGSVSQRACVFCGTRVVLYPIADAVHLVHGPIGCSAYTWDIRGALSSGPELHRLSFSTDLQEQDVIFGGERKLQAAIYELALHYKPQAVFVYATCIIGLIGDDVAAVCKKAQQDLKIPVIPVQAEGFKGTKKDGYKAACYALMHLIGSEEDIHEHIPPFSINILGEFNLAGEAWMIKDYYKELGINVLCTLTGDSRIHEIRRAHRAALNVVQCAGSMTYLAKMMQEQYGIPFIHVSYFGIEDMSDALYEVARYFKAEPVLLNRAVALVQRELAALLPELDFYRRKLSGKKAAIYVGGAFKAQSLIKALRHIGMETVLVGSQTGNQEDYRQLEQLCEQGTIIVDDSNPAELSRFLLEQQADIFIGGVKERPLAYKLGLGFCDHNHERKIALAGFTGMLNFAREVYASVMSPVWEHVRGLRQATAGKNPRPHACSEEHYA